MACWTENGGYSLPLGCCIAGVRFQNCVSQRNLEYALSRRRELTSVSTAITGTQRFDVNNGRMRSHKSCLKLKTVSKGTTVETVCSTVVSVGHCGGHSL